MDKKGIENFTLAQLSKLIKRNNPTGLDDDFIIIGENLPNTELFKYPCRVDALVAVICLEGELICNINLKEYRITTNMMIINTPENIIQVKDIGNRKFYGIAVSSAFFEKSSLDTRDMIPLYMQIQKEPCFHLSKEDTDIFCRFISLMQLICHTQDTPKKTATILRLGSALMNKIHDTILTHDSPSKNEVKMSRQEIFFGKFIALLTQHHTQERSVAFYAEKLCITPKYFSTLIKKQTGKSAAQWIDDYVILEAKNLLKFSGMSIQEIAYHLNFSTQSFFGKYFKHQTGLSPSEYRSSE